jgi:hypothetical protein
MITSDSSYNTKSQINASFPYRKEMSDPSKTTQEAAQIIPTFTMPQSQ